MIRVVKSLYFLLQTISRNFESGSNRFKEGVDIGRNIERILRTARKKKYSIENLPHPLYSDLKELDIVCRQTYSEDRTKWDGILAGLVTWDMGLNYYYVSSRGILDKLDSEYKKNTS